MVTANTGAGSGPIQDALVSVSRLLLSSGALSHSGHGNASERTDADDMVLTSRSSFRDLTAEALATVAMDGRVIQGSVDAANLEVVDMHAAVYRARPDVRAIVHTHSPYATAYALAHRPLPSRYESTIRFGIVDDIPVAPWGPRGSESSVRHIVATLEGHPTARAVLLANHGLLAFGASITEAARLAIALEEAAMMTHLAEALGGAQAFPSGALDEVRQRMGAFGLGGAARPVPTGPDPSRP